MKLCPCHSKKFYNICCEPLHRGHKAAENALELMRSRYSAYALGLIHYIIDTTHKTNPLFKSAPAVIENEIRTFCLSTNFDDLKIVEFIDAEEVAYVTFYARLHQGTSDVSFTEKSQFVKEQGKWRYLKPVHFDSNCEAQNRHNGK